MSAHPIPPSSLHLKLNPCYRMISSTGIWRLKCASRSKLHDANESTQQCFVRTFTNGASYTISLKSYSHLLDAIVVVLLDINRANYPKFTHSNSLTERLLKCKKTIWNKSSLWSHDRRLNSRLIVLSSQLSPINIWLPMRLYNRPRGKFTPSFYFLATF